MNSTNSDPDHEVPAVQQSQGAPPSQPRFPFAILFLVWLVVVIVSTLITFILPESYSSSARIKIERDQSDVAGIYDRGVNTPAPYDPYFIQTEFELMQSEVILGKVIADLDLNKDWGKKYGGGDPLKTTETINLLRGRMDLRPVRNTSLIEIRVFSEKAEEAAKIANAIAEAYRAHRLAQRRELSRGGIKALEERITEQDEKVRKVQQVVDDLRIKLNISDAMASTDSPSLLMTAESLRKLEALRIEVQAEYNRQRALLDQLRVLRKDLGPEGLAQAIPTAVPDAALSALLEHLGTAKQQLASLTKDGGPEPSEAIRVKRQVEALNSEIKSRVDGIMLGLDARVVSLSNSLDNWEKQVAQATSNDVIRANETRPYFDAKRTLEEIKRFRTILDMKIEAEKVDVELPKTTMVEIVDRAVPGFRPVRPNKPLNILVGIIVGSVAGFVLATLMYALEWRAFRREAGGPGMPFLRRFRAIVYLLIAGVVAIFVGYLLANPLGYSAAIVIPLILFVVGIAAACIALASLQTESAPVSAPRQTEPNDAALKQ